MMSWTDLHKFAEVIFEITQQFKGFWWSSFKGFWWYSFKISYFQKNFLHAMAVLGYLPKLKRGLGLAFGAYFLHDFPWKCSLFNTLLMDKISMSYLLSLTRYQTKYVIKFLFRQLMTS